MTNSGNTDYTTQAEAEREARTAIWGDVTFAQRASVGYRHDRKGDPLGVVAVDHLGIERVAVVARVNGKAVVFTFDSYGRRDAKPLILGKTNA